MQHASIRSLSQIINALLILGRQRRAALAMRWSRVDSLMPPPYGPKLVPVIHYEDLRHLASSASFASSLFDQL